MVGKKILLSHIFLLGVYTGQSLVLSSQFPQQASGSDCRRWKAMTRLPPSKGPTSLLGYPGPSSALEALVSSPPWTERGLWALGLTRAQMSFPHYHFHGERRGMSLSMVNAIFTVALKADKTPCKEITAGS